MGSSSSCLSVCLSVSRPLFKEPFSKKLCPIKTLSFFPLLKPTQTDPQTHSQGRAREEGAAEMKGWAGCWAGSASLLDTPSWIPGPSCSWRSSPITPSPFFQAFSRPPLWSCVVVTYHDPDKDTWEGWGGGADLHWLPDQGVWPGGT